MAKNNSIKFQCRTLTSVCWSCWMDVHFPTWYRVRSLSTQLQLIKSHTFSLFPSNLNSILQNLNQTQLKTHKKTSRSTPPTLRIYVSTLRTSKKERKTDLQRQQRTNDFSKRSQNGACTLYFIPLRPHYPSLNSPPFALQDPQAWR